LDGKEHLFHLRDNGGERKSMYLNAHQLVLLPSFDSSQDMIAFYRIALGTLVSERLEIALESEGISGIIFEESSVFEKWLQEENNCNLLNNG
jgi:hypothetical protein